MDLAAPIIQSKLWVKAVGEAIYAHGMADWTFYYCIEGKETKTWTVLFVNKTLEKCFLRSPYLYLKLKNALICESRYHSNVFRLLIEPTAGGLDLWEEKESLPQNNTQEEGNDPFPTSSTCYTYACSAPVPPTSESLSKSDPSYLPILEHDGKTFSGLSECQQIAASSGYLTYKPTSSSSGGGEARKKHKKKHQNKTWIPLVTVNSKDLSFRFKISGDTKRENKECLECLIHNTNDILDPLLSNLVINH